MVIYNPTSKTISITVEDIKVDVEFVIDFSDTMVIDKEQTITAILQRIDNSEPVPNADVEIIITNPEGNQSNFNKTTNDNGIVEHSFTPQIIGNWDITFTYGDVEASVSPL